MKWLIPFNFVRGSLFDVLFLFCINLFCSSFYLWFNTLVIVCQLHYFYYYSNDTFLIFQPLQTLNSLQVGACLQRLRVKNRVQTVFLLINQIYNLEICLYIIRNGSSLINLVSLALVPNRITLEKTSHFHSRGTS